MQDKYSRLRLLIIAAGVGAIVGVVAYNNNVFASHSFELGVAGETVPDNTHIRLDGLTLPVAGAMPLYDASPNYVAGHFLMRAPCDTETKVPEVTVIAGHIDESVNATRVDKVPLYYIDHASTAGSCVYHSHIPDPINGGAPRVTDIALINLSGAPITFNAGDIVDINVQRVLGKISDAPYEVDEVQLPGDLTHGNTVYDLNDDNPNNDGAGGDHEEGEA